MGCWQSPSGNAYAFPDSFAGDLARLCPGAASAADTCGAPLALGGTAAGLRWLDASRFLYLTREPASLSLVTLTGETASARPIVGWAAAEAAGMGSFAGVVPAPEP